MSKKVLSVVVPCFNEESAIPFFYKKICEISNEMKYVRFNILFVDDGSRDKTLSVIKDLSKIDDRVHYISFSRNFGKEAAMYAGLENCDGDYITIMDADLQDPPELLKEMYDYIEKDGYDCVATKRTTRKGEPPVRSFFARMFYKLINRISSVQIKDGARDYRLMTRQVVDSILTLKEYNRFSKGLFSFVGFKTKWLEYENIPRVAGQTKWSFFKLFKYSLDGICAFSTVPLAISTVMGFVLFTISLLGLLILTIKCIIDGHVDKWVFLTQLIIFTSGVQLLCIGILGRYLSKTYLEIKNRPIYIVKEEK